MDGLSQFRKYSKYSSWKKAIKQLASLQVAKLSQRIGYMDVKIRECGLFIHPRHNFIIVYNSKDVSPDGIISCYYCEF